MCENRVLRKVFEPKGARYQGSEESNIRRNLMITKYCSGDQVEKNEMGRVCSTYRVKVRCIQGCGGEC